MIKWMGYMHPMLLKPFKTGLLIITYER